jgi:hypothetical protein
MNDDKKKNEGEMNWMEEEVAPSKTGLRKFELT